MSLDWSDERYVRLYTRDTPSWLLGPWQARAVLPLVLRKLDRAGTIALGVDGLEALAIVVSLPLEVVEAGMAWWLRRGTFELVDGTLVAPNFIEAQEAIASDRRRQQEHRERKRERVLAAPVTKRDGSSRAPADGTADDGGSRDAEPSAETPDVTHRDEPSRNVMGASRCVTDRHEMSRDVTPSRAVPNQPFCAEPAEPVLPLSLAALATSPRGRRAAKAPAKGKREPRVVELFEHWVATRRRHGKSGAPRLDDKRAKAIGERLADGYDVETLKLAIDGLFLSPHHRGENDRGTEYLDVSHAMKNAKNVDAFVTLAGRESTRLPPADAQPNGVDGDPVTRAEMEEALAPLRLRKIPALVPGGDAHG